MCLDTIGNIYKPFKPDKAKFHYGWKVFEYDTDNDAYLFDNHSLGNSWDVPLNKWIVAKGKRIHGETETGGRYYPAGFHVFTDYDDCLLWIGGITRYDEFKIVRVKYRKVVAAGSQSGLKVIVAKEMYVPKPKSNK